MSRKLDHIPYIKSYDDIRNMMREDLEYRLESRNEMTSLGRPLYYRTNVQLVMTRECPYHCPFCIERQNPMEGEQDFDAQLVSLENVLVEHPDARLTVTGGEPGLYPEHVYNVEKAYKEYGNNVFMCVNTSGINTFDKCDAHINLSWNDYVKPDYTKFHGCTLQTVLNDDDMTLANIGKFISEHKAKDMSYSFRFMIDMDKKSSYPIDIWNELEESDDVTNVVFRVGDFFAYAYFNYHGASVRVTLGDMWQQQHNDYGDGYSNIIIHPDGSIGTNWR